MYWLNQTVDSFGKFRLDTVPEFWVVDIWDKLLDVGHLPQEFQEVHLDTSWPELLAETISCAQKCAPSRNNSSSTDGPSSSSTSEADGDNITLWTVALKRGICPKTLVAVLGFFVEKGIRCSGSITSASIGLQASHLYITLLSLPGNNAHQVFDNVIYQRAIESLQVVKTIARKDRESGTTSSKGPHCRKRGAANRRLNRLSQQSDVQAEDDPEEDGQAWTEAHVSRLTEKLFSFVRGIVRLLETYSFRSYKNLLDETVEKLCMLVLESDGSGRKALANTSTTAFDALAASCNALHGDVGRCVDFVMKHLLEVIITGASMSKALQLILHMMAEVGQDAVEGVKGLVQNICIRVPDKADGRARVATYIVCLLSQLPGATHAALVKWLRDRYMWSMKVAYRILVVELFARLLGQRQREPPVDGSVTDDMRLFLRHDTLLATVIQRCSDKAATVRSKALTVLVDCLSSTDPHVVEAVSRILSLQQQRPLETRSPVLVPVTQTPPNAEELAVSPLSLEEVTPSQDEGQQGPSSADSAPASVSSLMSSVSANRSSAAFNSDTLMPLMGSETFTNVDETELPNRGQMMELLKKRAAEEKVNVRKVALQVIESVLKIQAALLTTETLELLQNHCRDPSVMVRKQMAVSLTSLLQSYPQSEHVQRAWLHGVFPLIVDCESTVQEKCLELLDALLMQNITRYRDSMPTAQSMGWRIFHALAHEENQMFRYFQKALTAWYRQGKLKANLVGHLATHVGTANDGAAWLLLSFITLMVNVKDASYAADYWKAHFTDEQLNFTVLRQVLAVLANSVKVILPVDRDNLLDDMKNMIRNFDCPFELVSPMVSTVTKLYDTRPRASTNDSAQIWGSAVLQACNDNLSPMILNERYQLTDSDENVVLRQLHTMSDICFKCRLQPPKRLILAIESLIAASKFPADGVARTNSLKPLNDSAARPKIRAQGFVTLGKFRCLIRKSRVRQRIGVVR